MDDLQKADYAQPIIHSTDNFVSEAEYWEKYYDYPGIVYEWNNGVLEERPVADYLNYSTYDWFVALLRKFLKARPIAKTTGLGIGFRLELAINIVIRRPDLGVVLDSNPVSLEDDDKTYRGIFDLCVESLSDSTKEDIERDTVVKKLEYAAGGVREYYILDARSKHTAFYRQGARGGYVPIKPTKGGIIKSKVLPGFQFRRADLYQKPSTEEMMEDVAYKGFVELAHQETKKQLKRVKKARQEAKARQKACARALEEQQARQKAEAEIARLKALLATKVE